MVAFKIPSKFRLVDFKIPSTFKLNSLLVESVRQFSSIYIVDYFSIFARVGYDQAFDNKFWNMVRYPFGRKALMPISNEFGKFFRALSGKSKKCIVLDCDNTLWGGIIGEDGLSGIKIGDTHPGQSFSMFQSEIVNLYNRGVIVALCSKNNEEDVMEVFEKQSDMVLKKEHLTTWQVNWDDKATNLKRIASDLNIGLDSLVFVDDNPFECNLIKEQLPEVSVIQVEKDTTKLRKQLMEAGFFDSLTFSNEDKERNKMYHSENKRKEILKASGSLEDYLKSLSLKVTIGLVGDGQIPRVAQLTQKTNQFNLTTIRYSEADIEKFTKNDNRLAFYMRLEDKVSDLGIIGVSLIEIQNKVAILDSLLMSCRALGRGAEKTLIHQVTNYIFSNYDVESIQGNFFATAKNKQVKTLLSDNCFSVISKNDNESEINFELRKIDTQPSLPEWIELIFLD